MTKIPSSVVSKQPSTPAASARDLGPEIRDRRPNQKREHRRATAEMRWTIKDGVDEARRHPTPSVAPPQSPDSIRSGSDQN